MAASAIFFTPPSTQSSKDAVILGQGLPLERDGQPIKYFWRESLLLGSYQDADGKKFTIDSTRIERLIDNFKLAKSRGFLPYIPPDHKSARADKNYGFVVDAKKNEKGNLELLHQAIGEDSILAHARNRNSICTITDVVDEHGHSYSELIDHNCLTPSPQLNELDTFRPAIAASRGSVPATTLTLAAQKEEPMLDLKKLRTTLKAADDLADEKVIELALSRIVDAEPAAAKLATAENDLKTIRAEHAELRKQFQTSEGKVLELSRRPEPIAPPTPREMLVLSRSLKSDRQAAIEAGGVSPDCAKELDKLFETDGRPNGLALSSVGSGADDLLAFRVWSILKTNKPTPIGEKTGMQFGRQTPVDDPDQKSEKELAEAGYAQGKAYAGAGAK